jgi:hypothetical protein
MGLPNFRNNREKGARLQLGTALGCALTNKSRILTTFG